MDQKIDPSSDKSPKKLSQDPQISLQKTLKSKNPVNGPLSIKTQWPNTTKNHHAVSYKNYQKP